MEHKAKFGEIDWSTCDFESSLSVAAVNTREVRASVLDGFVIGRMLLISMGYDAWPTIQFDHFYEKKSD